MSIYTQNGYKDRAEYIRSLAEDYDVPLNEVISLAQLLGPEEDFDGLVVMVDDRSQGYM